MKTKLFLYLALIFIGMTTSSCFFDFSNNDFDCVRGNGDIDTKELFLNDFHSVKLNTSANVFVTQGNEQSIRVDLDENLFQELDRDVFNGTWEIEFDRCVKNIHKFDVYITIPDIRKLTISGSGDIVGENVFIGDDLDLKITGSGQMDIAFEGEQIDADITGSGDMRLEGEIERLDFRVSGSGDLQAFKMISDISEIDIRGSGDAEITVNDLLIVRIDGSGDVFYKGDPELDIKINGSGDVIKVD